MTIYAVGNEHDSYKRHQTPRYQTATKSATADYGITTSADGFAVLDIGSSLSECWVHFKYTPATILATANITFLALHNLSTGKDALRLVRSGSNGDIVLQYNNTGTTYTTITTVATSGDASTHVVDMYFKRGGSGELRVFVNGTLRHTSTGSYVTVDATWDCVYLGAPFTNSNTYQFCDVIVADHPCIGYTLHSLTPSGAGTVNDWTGDYADLLGTTGKVDKTKAIHSAAAGDDCLFAYEDMTLPSGQQIIAVSVATAASFEDSSGIADLELLVRHAGSTTSEGSLGVVANKGLFRGQKVLDLNPAGGTWTESAVNAIEFGVRTT